MQTEMQLNYYGPRLGPPPSMHIPIQYGRLPAIVILHTMAMYICTGNIYLTNIPSGNMSCWLSHWSVLCKDLEILTSSSSTARVALTADYRKTRGASTRWCAHVHPTWICADDDLTNFKKLEIAFLDSTLHVSTFLKDLHWVSTL